MIGESVVVSHLSENWKIMSECYYMWFTYKLVVVICIFKRY